jgi:hypothetical protein
MVLPDENVRVLSAKMVHASASSFTPSPGVGRHRAALAQSLGSALRNIRIA